MYYLSDIHVLFIKYIEIELICNSFEFVLFDHCLSDL